MGVGQATRDTAAVHVGMAIVCRFVQSLNRGGNLDRQALTYRMRYLKPSRGPMRHKFSLIRNQRLRSMGCIILLSVGAASQVKDDTRGLVPREYASRLSQIIAKKRPHSRSNRRPPVIRYVPTSRDNSPMAPGFDVGVTFFRLRLARKIDDPVVVEPRRIVKRIKGKEVESTVKLIPERVQSEMRFSDGEKLRVSIEAPFESFVYILNQEQYVDGTFSDPFLIYPSLSDIRRNTRAAPGRLIYVPEGPDYFEISTLNPGGKKKTGEVFTIVLSSELVGMLPPLDRTEDTRKIDQVLFNRLQHEIGGAVWKFKQVGEALRNITRVEKKAGPNGGGLLEDFDPQPETIYHVARRGDGVLLFQIAIKIAQ